MGPSKRVPSPNLTEFETVFRRQKPTSNVQTTLVPRSEKEFATRPSVTRSDLADDRPMSSPIETLQTILVPRSENELAATFSVTKSDFVGDRPTSSATETLQTILVPRSENEFAATFGVTKSDFASDRSTSSTNETHNEPVTNVSPSISTHTVAEPNLSTAPASEGLFHAINSSKEKSSFSSLSAALLATVALMAGVAAGVVWPWKLLPASSSATIEQSVVSQLHAITEELSSLRRDLEDLAARQQHIAEAQEQLAAAQARLAAAQERATAQPDHAPSTRVNRSRRAAPNGAQPRIR